MILATLTEEFGHDVFTAKMPTEPEAINAVLGAYSIKYVSGGFTMAQALAKTELDYQECFIVIHLETVE